MPKVSVIVPIYNVEKYLDRCIGSILSQTLTDFELILVDDGSMDKSGEICDTYKQKDKRIIVLHEKNKGVSYARNAGLHIAIGEYIIFVDSDDYVKPKYLELLTSSTSDLCLCGADKVLENGQITCIYDISNRNETVTIEKIVTWFENGYLSVVWGKAFKRSLLESLDLHFDIDLQYGEDTVFTMEYASHCTTVSFINSQLYVYYKYNSETLTKTYSRNSVISFDLLDKHLSHFFFSHHTTSSLFESINYASKYKMKYAFFNIYENQNLTFIEKYEWYKLFFSLESFNKNLNIIFAEYPKKLKIILHTRCSLLLCIFQIIAKTYNMVKIK